MSLLRRCRWRPSASRIPSRTACAVVWPEDEHFPPARCASPDEGENQMRIRLSEQALLTCLNARAGSLIEPARDDDRRSQRSRGYLHVWR